ncbi:hypothetical protein EDD80_11548 [Anseongella ginsenosidimutans]|uniref:Uncharacterized protein n=1 Tax=Anseongella ginsenosidimutans TaxID=496056 RepID=A0A4R3KM85_9SPHI|nr:hypothetical protein [Anseongella ginsenosidimutans]QEC51911.1 hypothetical protein FRZ59_05890 [Anseongella ginsenosidimutans]TCS85065.1 hypothetical protein EDD80_11548 [Anseongella ginsenosidimutans]
MRRKLLLSTLLFIGYYGYGQTLLDSTLYRQTLDNTRNKLFAKIQTITEDGKVRTSLVSEYTFRKLVQEDFSLLLTGDKSKTAPGRYAALEINEDGQRVTITPFAWHRDPMKGPSRWMGTLDVNAGVNGKNIWDFGGRKKLSLGGSITLLGARYLFRPRWKETDKKKQPSVDDYNKIYTIAQEDMMEKRNAIKHIIDTLDFVKIAGDTTSLKRAYLEQASIYERKLTDDKWNARLFYWAKLNIVPVSLDYLDIVGLEDSSSYQSPMNKKVFTPSLQLSGNIYGATRRWGDAYLNGWIRIGFKHNLSEIYSTTTWNKISPLGDSAVVIEDSKEVYVLEKTALSKKALADVGGQLIYYVPKFKWLYGARVGIDLSMTSSAFMSPTDASTSHLETYHAGFVVSLPDKDGTPSVNLQVFHQWKKYIDYQGDAEGMWGMKFSIPFNSLFN